MVEISANIIAWNEETVIDLALRSVKDFADEVILVDNGSTDRTVKYARQYFKRWNLRGKIIVMKNARIYDCRYHAMKESTGDWICIVDGDHVLNTSPNKPNIHTLRKLAERGGQFAYNFLYFHMYGDFRHLDKSRVISDFHPMLFRNIPKKLPAPHGRDKKKGVKRARWGLRWNNPEFLYPEVNKPEIIGVNLAGMKPSIRMFSRQYIRYRHRADKPKNLNMIDYALRYSKAKNMRELKQLADRWFIKRLATNTVKIEKGLCIERNCMCLKPNRRRMSIKIIFKDGVGQLPKIIQEELESPRYELIYKNGKVIGRKPDLVR